MYLLSKLVLQLVNETDGKGTVSKVGYLFDNPASFRKLEIEPNAFLNSHGQTAPWYEAYKDRVSENGLNGL